jgi:HK97 family phage prohead protease
MLRAELTVAPAHRHRIRNDVATFQFQEAAAPVGEFAGWASTFGEVIDGAVEPTVMVRGCWAKSIVEDFDTVKILWAHDSHQPIGRPLELRETEYGLWIRAAITQTARRREITQLLQDKTVDALSVGFDVVDAYRQDGIRYITAARCWECSLVTWGADKRARIMEAYRRPGWQQSAMRDLDIEHARLETCKARDRVETAGRRRIATIDYKLRLQRLDALEHGLR